MRVTHVITRLIVGGAQENTVSTVLGLHKRGFEVDLISGPTTGPEGTLETAFKQHPQLLKIVPNLVRPVDPKNDYIALRKLTQIFRSTCPEIVHTHSGKAGILGRIAAERASVPLIIHTIHGPSFGSFQGRLANLVFRTAERRAAKSTTHFISVANAMTEQYLAARIGRPEQYSRILSGFDLAPFLSAHNDLKLRSDLGIGPNDFVVGKIARLFELKGHDDLIAVAPELTRKCPNIKFLFVGGGNWREKFEAQVRSLGLAKHFVFAGLVSPASVAHYVGIMDVLVHLSRREGLPRALPQAMAAGKPVIALDCDGAREVCLNDQTGFLLAPDKHLNQLVKHLTELGSNQPLRHRLGQRGQTLVKDLFPVEKMVDHIAELYLALKSKKTRH